MKIAFYDTKPYDKIWFEPMAKEAGMEMIFHESKLNEDTVMLAKECDAVCIFVNDTANKEVIEQLVGYGVKGILLCCAGFNNVDFRTAKDHITVYRVPSYSPEAVAEYTMAMILAVNRQIHRAYVRTKEFNFSIHGLMGIDLHDKVAGVIGTGKIGQMMIDILKGFKMKILAYDLFPNEKLDVDYVDLDTLLKESDVITLHCPLTAETKHIICKESIEKMKDGVILVNSSRGALIKTSDLIDGLNRKKFLGVGLDVYEEEEEYFFEDKSNEIVVDEELVRLTAYPNVIISSHQAFFTTEAMKAIAQVTIENAKSLIQGVSSQNEVKLLE